jgi:hypothetical protein
MSPIRPLKAYDNTLVHYTNIILSYVYVKYRFGGCIRFRLQVEMRLLLVEPVWREYTISGMYIVLTG